MTQARDTPHLCGEPYCPNIVDGPGRCDVHRHGRATSGTPGYGHAWRQARNTYIHAHPDCERCGQPALDVHHRDGRHPSSPGANAQANLESLCRHCHRTETEHTKRARRTA